ncbi:imidazole glycerol phosphate synthase subunit HisH [Phytomonospora endophytica]|uniref:Imidazole glycerol phosphate synthase subunit HisH n=1 Tax=Phytomonospora endophytica TaxID=714109 RepID=A0A841FG18_9ACTN|nr:imidazole glycerol phosphate synthase subunit HisH [Phytomonospora endophytica]MBB6032788.1 glutamine amidotransferase [Phytomonospora endophytica]GIG66063.1 imidazole glycerol phosphate synthase subunit HisH [Phytomonospora endophytica]
MTANVVVADYGSGNLRSVERAVARTGAKVTVTGSLTAAREADGLVVPGVGAYAACMAGIEELGFGPVIAERVAAGAPVLGICVGMQILFETGEEHGVVTKGLGLLPGTVSRLETALLPTVRVPHMGWNTVERDADFGLFDGIAADERFYFVHSYAAPPEVPGAQTATTVHGGRFLAAVRKGALSAAQFHPEKSGDAGAALLANWVGEIS